MHWALERLLVGRADRQTIAKHARGKDRLIGIGTMASAALLGLALTQPLLTAEGFMGLAGDYSLLRLLGALWQGGNGLLVLIIALLVILLPVALLSLAFDIWYKHALTESGFLRKARLLRPLGRMLLPVILLVGAALYGADRAGGTGLHIAAAYGLLSLALLKLILARLQPMIDSVRFVEEEE